MKIKFNARPTFSAEVSIPQPDAEPLKFRMTFKHRGKDELKQFAEQCQSGELSEVDIIMGCAEGWSDEVDEKFGRDAVARLVNTFHASAGVIAATYIAELRQARSGN